MVKEKIGLGTHGEDFKPKVYYFVWIAFLFLYMFWAWIGNPSARQSSIFYILLGFMALIFILFDNATKKTFKQLDTVTIEEPRIKFLTPKISLIIAIIFGIIIGLGVSTTRQVWVQYPTFQIFGGFLDAILSGVYGVVENLVFFSFLFATLYAILFDKTKNGFISLLLAMVFITLGFSFFHIFVYGTQIQVIFSTVIFSLMNCVFVYLFRNTLITDAFHFSNNVVGSLVSASIGLVFQI